MIRSTSYFFMAQRLGIRYTDLENRENEKRKQSFWIYKKIKGMHKQATEETIKKLRVVCRYTRKEEGHLVSLKSYM